VRIKELAIPVALIAVIGSLLVPVPAIILDLLIVTNLLFALGLVALALQSTDSLKLSALPTILLLSTLFRLCLNVSTSRLILSHGQGGQMVEAFGNFVLQGSIGVGIVLFLMLTLIQFIVIAKGSERVAEVAARFTLDALPGKQMAIDADVRAGMYDMQTARLKRQELQTESRFYGALDGSMKFIKGDAIAGICIVVINIFGGLVAGLVNGLSFSEAAHLYTILTVGDGLASQIPALLNSLAAGLVVTRVGQNQDVSLSSEMLQQIFQSKGVFVLASVTSMSLGLVPGMPSIPLFSIGIGCLVGSIFSQKKKIIVEPKITSQEFEPARTHILELVHGITNSANIVLLKASTEKLREKFFLDAGILIPAISLRFDESLTKDNQKKLIFLLRSALLKEFNITNLNHDNSELSLESIVDEMLVILKDNREEFIDDAHTKRLLDWYEQYNPDLVASVQNNNFINTTQFTELLRGLASEGIALSPLDRIIQGILEMAPKIGTDRPLIDEIRVYMKRSIHNQLFGTKTTIKAAILDVSFESELFLGDGDKEVMQPITVSKLVEVIKDNSSHIDAVIASKTSRRLLAEVCSMYQVKTPIISHAELLTNITIEPVIRITKDLVHQDMDLEASHAQDNYATH
jgi:flagellar biosynthesis component FlhA